MAWRGDGEAWLCPALGAETEREREARREALLTKGGEEGERDDGGSRHSRGGGRLLLRRGRRRGRRGNGGDLLGALPVLLCFGAWPGSGTRTRRGGLGRAWSRGRGRTGALRVVHVLSSGPRVRLPVGVVVLFGGANVEKGQLVSVNVNARSDVKSRSGPYLLKLGCSRRMWVQRRVLGRGGVLVVRRFLFVGLLADMR